MKRTITRSLAAIVSLVLILWTGTLFAQSEEQIEKFNQEREAYFTEELELTDAEAEAFWPLYNDFHNRKMKIIEEERNTFRYSHKIADNLSDQEINETLEKILVLKNEQFELEQKYYRSKFPEVLPPKKVLKLYKAEWDFRGHLIRKIRGHGQGGPGGPNERGKGKSRSGSGQEPMGPPPAF